MKLIEVKITLEENVWQDWACFYNGGEDKAASSLHNDIKLSLDKLGIEDYKVVTKLIEKNDIVIKDITHDVTSSQTGATQEK